MELRKALEILNYPGDMWYIHPYVVNGSIVRNTVFKVKRNRRSDDWGRFTFDDIWGKGVYFTYKSSDTITENTEINTDVRVFTARSEAKDALAEFEKQHAYKISETADLEIKRLEKEKEEINKQIKKLKEIKERAFKNLSTSFSK